MKPLIRSLLTISILTGAVYGGPNIDSPEAQFEGTLTKAVSDYIHHRKSSIEKPKLVTFYLISPTPYTDAEFEIARSEKRDLDPFWIDRNPHEVFSKIELTAAQASAFGKLLIDDLLYEEVHGEFSLASLCTFKPMHGFKIEFEGGKSLSGAICVHCNDLFIELPSRGIPEYRGIQTKDLAEYTTKILPIPKELEERYFPKSGSVERTKDSHSR